MADEVAAPPAAEPEPSTAGGDMDAALAALSTDEPAPAETPAPGDATDPDQPAGEKPAEPAPADDASRASKMVASAASRERKALEREKQAKLVIEKAALVDAMLASPAAFVDAAQKQGWSAKQIAEALLAQAEPKAEPTEADKMREEINALKAERVTEKQQALAREQAHIKRAITTDLEADPARFGLIKAFGRNERVFEQIVKYYQATNEEPDPKDVADLVVKEIRAKEDPALVAHWEKFFSPPPAAPQSPTSTAVRGAPQPTLTSKGSSRVPPAEDQLPVDGEARAAAVLRLIS